MKVLATYSIKGGVGKTTAAVNLAHEAAQTGVRVLVWDLDPQGAATYVFRVRPKVKGGSARLVGAKGQLATHVRGTELSAVHLVPADFSLRNLDLHLEGRKNPTDRLATLLEPLRDHYDLALLDCPPSISLVSESVFEAADALIVPIIPATLSSRTLEQLHEVLSGWPKVLGFFSMADRRKTLHRQIMDELAGEHDVLETVIPNSADVERMGSERAALVDFAPRSRAARAYADLWEEVRRRLETS